ncbi:MAG: cyclase family protein [Methanolinea sp.]|nr:cyclase family protein [Methanolinea sp.]
MAYHDVTRPLKEGIAVYPGDIEPSFRQEDRGRYLLSDLHLSTHTGTHIDAPSHYIRGSPTVDRIPPENLVGECRVVGVPGRQSVIDTCDLCPGTERVLFRTWYSDEGTFREDYPGLSPRCAATLAGLGIRCAGIDSPSIEPYDGDGTVHRTLLGHGITVIEFLDLSAVGPGKYWMVALPLRLEGLDGSPCRVFLGDTR